MNKEQYNEISNKSIGLVISRRVNEKIYIFPKERGEYGPIAITLSKIRGNKAKIGISARKNYEILREEVADKKIKEGDLEKRSK